MTPYQRRLYEQKTDINYSSVGKKGSKSPKKPSGIRNNKKGK